MRILRLAVALVLLSALVPARAVPAAEHRTIVFGSALALSGTLASEGKLTREGYDFWMHYVNAHGGLRVGKDRFPVEIRYVDDESNPQTAARAVERLITEDKVDFILGPYSSGQTFAAATVAEKHGVPMTDSGGAAERIFNQGYRYTFGVLSPAHKYLVGIIEFAVRRTPRPKTIAISAASDSFSLEVQQGAVQSANDHGIRVVYADRYTDDAASITAVATAIKAANPEIILNAGHLKDALMLHRALKEQRVAAKIYGYSVGPDTPEFRTTLGSDAQAVLGSAQWSPAVTYAGERGFYRSARDYASAFTKEMGHEPDYHNAEATAAGLAFQYAIERSGSVNRDTVRDALARLDVVTFFGLLKFDTRGLNVFKPMVVNQIQGQRLKTIYPYRLADATAVYPAPAPF
jgi:branched-chain amino acid transport system substrate-binding protein